MITLCKLNQRVLCQSVHWISRVRKVGGGHKRTLILLVLFVLFEDLESVRYLKLGVSHLEINHRFHLVLVMERILDGLNSSKGICVFAILF